MTDFFRISQFMIKAGSFRSLIILACFFVMASAVKSQTEEPEGVVIDQVVGVVGGNVILLSDIEAQFQQFKLQQGINLTDKEMKCELMESMIYQKLLLNQAELDSVVISDSQVESELDRRLRYYISMLGSKEKFEEFYQKTVTEFKEELREQVRELMMVDNVQQTLTADIKITPTEIRAFFKKIPQDSLPFINSEVRLAQIVKLPPINPEEIDRVRSKLAEFRLRVINGENFATLAILYSEDPGSAKQGGELGMFGRGEMYPEFEAAAFSLEKGQVSEIVKTEAGYHILQLIERRGEMANVRHILLRPKVSISDLAKAKLELDSIATLIEQGKFTFDEAVIRFSDDPSKNNNGLLINPMTNSSFFEASQLDPRVFFVIDKLEVGDLSAPVQFVTTDGKDAYRVLKLLERTEPHQANLKQDYDKIQNWALEEKKQKALKKWVDEKVKNTYLKINEDYKNCEFLKSWQL